MPLTRRAALKNIIIISGGIILIPSCVRNEGTASIPLKNIKLNADQEKMLADISEAIIPTTDTPGAKELMTHIYTMKMVDDCLDSKRQKEFMNGLNDFNKMSRKAYNKDYMDLSMKEKQIFINDIDHQKYGKSDVSTFIGMMKSLTIEGYMTSKYVGTKLVIYELVPGRFHGSFPINKNEA